jgi:DNA-binding transcriptional regulator/RsmH inhibitor MraZ
MKTQAFAIGRYRVHLGPDGRIRLPAKWRDLFITTAAPVLMLVPLDGTHLTMVPQCRIRTEMKAWKTRERRSEPVGPSGQASIDAVRAAMEAAMDVPIGADGRFTVPRVLREQVGLSGEVELTGCFNAAEIWSPAKWREEEKRLQSLVSLCQDIGF